VAAPLSLMSALGTALLAAYVTAAAFGLCRLLAGLKVMLAAESEAKPLAGRPGVMVTERLDVPLLSLKGRILIPSRLAAELSPEKLAMVLRHEEEHRRRGDHRFFLVLALIDTVFWFHPAVRAQTARCRLTAELACDRAACGSGAVMRRDYAQLVLSILNAAGSARPCAPAVFSPRTQGEFQMRLIHIMRPEKRRRKRALVPLLCALGVPLTAGQLALAEGGRAGFPVSPVAEGRVTSTFGVRTDPFTKEERSHHGLDIAAPLGTPVRAPADGKITRAEKLEAYGYLMEVTHEGGILTRYAQLDGFEAKVGDEVRAGETIARLGSSGRSTGPHLHLEVFVNGERVDPASVVRLPGQ
jgi:hypothetical protein